MTLPELPKPLQAVRSTELASASHEPKITPVYDTTKNKLTHYTVISPSGNQKFDLKPDHPQFVALTGQLLDNMKNEAEQTLPLTLAGRVVESLRRFGVPEDKLPTSPEAALDQLSAISATYEELEKQRLEILKLNAQQSLLQTYIETFSMNQLEWLKLPEPVKTSLGAIHSAITAQLAREMGVDTMTVKASRDILEIQTNMAVASRISGALGQAIRNISSGVSAGTKDLGRGLGDTVEDLLPATGGAVGGFIGDAFRRGFGKETTRDQKKALESQSSGHNIDHALPAPLSFHATTRAPQPPIHQGPPVRPELGSNIDKKHGDH